MYSEQLHCENCRGIIQGIEMQEMCRLRLYIFIISSIYAKCFVVMHL